MLKRFRQLWLKLSLPAYTRLMAKQRFTARSDLPQPGATVLLFDKKASSGHPALAKVEDVDEPKKLLKLTYSSANNRKETTTRAYESVALICNPGDKNIVDLDPFSQPVIGDIQCDCLGTRPCPLQDGCVFKAAEELLEMGGEDAGHGDLREDHGDPDEKEDNQVQGDQERLPEEQQTGGENRRGDTDEVLAAPVRPLPALPPTSVPSTSPRDQPPPPPPPVLLARRRNPILPQRLTELSRIDKNTDIVRMLKSEENK